MKFENAVIYRIVCKDVTVKDCYVGSTTNFTKRKCSHKNDCTNENSTRHNFYVYKFIRLNGGWDNWEMIEICKASECTTKQQLCKIEREHIEQLKATLNKIIPTRTDKEYYEANKEQIKKYYELNKEQKIESVKKYYEINKEHCREKAREHRNKNKEAINARRRELYKLKQAKTTTKSDEDGVQQI